MNSDFKTAEELGITEKERAALIELEQEFRRAVCVVPVEDISNIPMDPPGSESINTVLGFNMNLGAGLPTTGAYGCGCVACIGGHVSLKLQGFDTRSKEFDYESLREAHYYVMRLSESGSPLEALFFPDWRVIDSECWDQITPAIAADAILRFLWSGDPDWDGLANVHNITRAPPKGDPDWETYYLTHRVE